MGLDAATGHAAVLRLDDHSDAPRPQSFPDRLRHLRGQAFLHLQAGGIAMQDPREFRDPDDALMRLAGMSGEEVERPQRGLWSAGARGGEQPG